MLKYTICFIVQQNKVLLLNREKAPWMGRWNGVGGKIEPGETPHLSVLREVREETGITLDRVSYKGIVTWESDDDGHGGMYLFVAYLPETTLYETPKVMREGILDWKSMDWIMHPDNEGVASNIPYFLPSSLRDDAEHEHHCIFKNGIMVSYEKRAYGRTAEPYTRRMAGLG